MTEDPKSAELEERQRLEAALWDEYVHRPGLNEDLTVHLLPPHWLEPKLRWAFDALGDVKGKRILDYGCGTGRSAVYLAKMGAMTCGFDISPESIAIARRRAEVNGVAELTNFQVMGGERLEYADESFDIIFGQSILHHIVLDLATPEMRRVLRPGGIGVFLEPQGTNPLITFVRAFVPYPGKKVHGTDRPLTRRDIRLLEGVFSKVEWQSFDLFTGVEKLIGFRRRFPLLWKLDRALLRGLPFLWWLAIYMGVKVTR
ncbi:MAG: class I SAM-dependent methyltransferase [Candidatus Sumerlaeia bacterium]|nr:class I SAM-dependent methyltransferase [Candidatus Sumerlaeia bacterium]